MKEVLKLIDKMSEKAKTYLIYGMVAFVTILFISAFFIGKKEEQKIEEKKSIEKKIETEQYQEKQAENKYQSEEEIIQKKKEEVKDDITDKVTKFDSENDYIKKFGKSSFKQSENIARVTVEKWLRGSKDWDKENDIMTLGLIEDLKLESAVDDAVERVVKIGSVYPVSAISKYEMKFEVGVSWKVKAGKKLAGGRSTLAYVTVVKDNGKWKAKELIVT